MKTQYKLPYNVTYVLRDKDGNIKPLFQENKLARLLLKHGLLKAEQSNFIQSIPYLFGQWQDYRNVANLVTSAGKAGAASRINGSGAEAAFTYIAIGIGAVAAAAGDTALGSEIATGGGARVAGTVSRDTGTVTNDRAVVQTTFTFTASFAVTESGLLNAATAGVLLARQVFTAVNVVSGDSLQVTWKVQAS